MTADQYRQLRKTLGTQAEVAELLGCTRLSIARRETGSRPVTLEAAVSIENLAKLTASKSVPRAKKSRKTIFKKK